MKKLIVILVLCFATAAYGQANLNWQDNATNEDGFILERQLNGGAFTVLAAAIAANLVSYNDGTATGSTVSDNVYCYRVKAFNTAGQSAFSNTACKTIPKIITIPNAPSGLQVSAISKTEIRLSWKDNSNTEVGFQAERRGGGDSAILEYAMNQTTAVDSGLQRNTRYDYRMRSLGDAGASAWTNRVKTKTQKW